MSSIFVSVASFKDPEIFSTVFDLYDKASDPSRVYAGVLLQDTVSVLNNFSLSDFITNSIS